MRERRETLSFLSFLPRRERPLLAGNINIMKGFRSLTSGLIFKTNKQTNKQKTNSALFLLASVYKSTALADKCASAIAAIFVTRWKRFNILF